MVDIIFDKVVCISIPGGLPELTRPQLIMGVNCPYLGQLNKDSSRYGNTDSFGKNDVYQVGCYGKRGQLRVHVFWCGIPL